MKELPEDSNLLPPISFQLFTKTIIKNSHTPLGICVSQPLNELLIPSISKTQQKERPDYSSKITSKLWLLFFNQIRIVLEIEEDDDEEEKKSKIKKKIKKKKKFKVINAFDD